MTTPPPIGSSADIQDRVLKVLPRRWWQWAAPIRDAIIGGLSDLASWSYGIIGYVRAQTRLATTYGIWLDVWSYDFLGRLLPRNGAIDDAFRIQIKTTILQERVTRNGMSQVVSQLSGAAPFIFEPSNSGDTGAYSSPLPGGFKCGQCGFGVGKGGYGNMKLPGQVFMGIYRTGFSGVPNVAGYGTPIGGYGVGAQEYLGSYTTLTGITNQIIEYAINKTKPTGVTCWIQFLGSPSVPVLTSETNLLLTSENTSELLAK